MRSRIAVIDSNVLFSIELTDLFVTFAKRRLIQLRWSEDILSEVRQSLIASGRLSPSAIHRRLAAMQRALPDALTEASPDVAEKMEIYPSDRHVLALAVITGADSVVTLNVRDFPSEYCQSLGVVVLSPDNALTEIATEDSLGVKAALQEISQRRRMPSMSVAELLNRWAPSLPMFAEVAHELMVD